MMTSRLLLCTDMDRTIIPNGRQPEHPDARAQFRNLCSLPEVVLTYVTGRHFHLMQEAIERYNLPEPAYAITDVGTRIYEKINNNWIEICQWQEQIAKDWRGQTHGQLQRELSGLAELKLQEGSKQNEYKLSYYLPLDADYDMISQQVEQLLTRLGVAASLIMSIDEPERVGLLDILPKNATKLHAIEFLQRYLGFGLEETIFCGDSGNDLPVLASPIRSILVANAEQDIKTQALELTEKNRYTESLYLADQQSSALGGNYSAGVLQGIAYYAPGIMKKITIS